MQKYTIVVTNIALAYSLLDYKHTFKICVVNLC